MGATIAAKALVILALLGAGATGIYAVANKGFGSGKQTEKNNEESTRADTPPSAKPGTAPEGGVSAPAGTASGAQGSDGRKTGTQAEAKEGQNGQQPPSSPSPETQTQNNVNGEVGGTPIASSPGASPQSDKNRTSEETGAGTSAS